MNNTIRYVVKCITKMTFLFVLAGVITIYACKEEDDSYPLPSIDFKSGSGYLNKDTTLLLSEAVKIGIVAKSNSDIALTHFNISILNDSVLTTVDTGIHIDQFDYDKIITKGISENEKWSFYVKDRDGRKSEVISINLIKDTASTFGPIITIPSIILGAQNNTLVGGFYSLSKENIYTQIDAFNNQDLINLVYYYDLIEADKNTIASPGANIDNSVFPGSTGLSNWTTTNTTRFDYQEDITYEAFDNCNNDSLILANTFEFATGKRKSKNLAFGHIYSFVTENNRNGLFKIINVVGKNSGTIEIAIKMQDL